MAEVDKEDIRRIHNRIDNIDKRQQSHGEILARIDQYMSMYKQPCEALVLHLEAHKETRKLWQQPIVRSIVHLLELGIVALLTWVFLS